MGNVSPTPVAADAPALGQIAAEFLDRLNNGERPSVEEYAQRHPQLAQGLRQVLEALEAVHISHATAEDSSSLLEVAPRAGPPTLGDFRILREIGRGGMGLVYEAEQLSLARRVAVKVLPFAASLDPKQLQRFRTEAQAAALLHHQHIVPVYSVGCDRGVHYYAMQFIEGQSVATLIHELRQSSHLDTAEESSATETYLVAEAGAAQDRAPSLPPVVGPSAPATRTSPALPTPSPARPTPPVERAPTEEAAAGAMTNLALLRETNPTAYMRRVTELAVQAAEALEHAHGLGVTHRDIKPANLLVDSRGTLWITDFGLARLQGDPGLTMTGDLMGTIRYMSPEQALANRITIDHRTDIYSLGVTLYELVSLRPVFEGSSRQELLRQIAFEEPRPLRQLVRVIPRDLETIVLKAIAKNPAERYATAQDLANDLRRFLDDQPIRARRPSLLDRGWKWSRRHRPLVASVLLFALLALVGSTLGALGYASQQRQLADERSLVADEQSRIAEEARVLATDRTALADQERRTREATAAGLYRALLGRAAAVRLARTPGYRSEVFEYLHQAVALDTPDLDMDQIEAEVLACLGDPIGMDAVDASAAELPTAPPPPAALLGVFKQNPEASYAATADGTRFAVVQSGVLTLWLLQAGAWNHTTLASPLGYVHSVRFTPDGSHLIGGCEEGLAVWSAPEFRLPAAYRCEVVRSVAVHPGGRLFAGITQVGRIEIWSLVTNRLHAALSAPQGTASIEFDSSGAMLLALSPAGTILAGRSIAVTPEKRYFDGHSAAVTCAIFGPDGRWLVSAGKDRLVRFWDAGSGELLASCAGHEQDIEDLAITPDGRFVATGDWSGEVRVWEVQSGREVARASGRPTLHSIWRLRFDAGGTYLAAAGSDGIVAWKFTATDEAVALTPLATVGQAGLIELALHPNGAEAVVLDRSSRIWTCDLTRDAVPRELPLDTMLLKESLHFAANRLVFATRTGELGQYDWESQETTSITSRRFAMPRNDVSHDGRFAAVLDPAARAAVYDLESDRGVFDLPPESSEPYALDWSADGRKLALGLSDGGLVVWDLEQVRARLAEFGIETTSTASAAPTQPTPAAAPDLERMAELQTTVRQAAAAILEASAYETAAAEASGNGKYIEAGQYYREALRLREQILVQAPDDVANRRGLAATRCGLARALDAIGQSAESAQLWRDGIAMWRELVAADGDDPQPRRNLAAAHADLGRIESLAERWDEAREALGHAIVLYGQLAEDGPEESEDRYRLADSYEDLASLERRAGRADEAEAALASALLVAEELVLQYPTSHRFVGLRGRVLQTQSLLARARSDLPLARDLLERAVNNQWASLMIVSECEGCRQGLRRSLEGLVDVLIQLDDAEAADGYLERAVALEPADPLFWRMRAAAHLARDDLPGYGRVCREIVDRLGQLREKTAVAFVLPALAAAPDNPADRDQLAGLVESVATAANRPHVGPLRYRLGDYEAAAADLETIPEGSLAAGDLLFLAMAHHQLGHADQAAEYLQRAVAWMEEADRTPFGSTDAHLKRWTAFYLRVEAERLRREAETLIGTSGTAQ